MRTAFLVGVTLFLAGMTACAGTSDEYVSPVFCYRILVPGNASKVTPDPDESGVSMELEGPCGQHPCIRIVIAATYLNNDKGDAANDLADDAGLGWITGSKTRRQVRGTTWNERWWYRNGAIIGIYTNNTHHDQTRYIIRVQSPVSLDRTAKKAADDILSSWRWLSACQ